MCKVHVTTWIHSRHHAAYETLLEYIQRFTNLVIQAICTDPTTVTCQVTLVLFIKHLFNKETKTGGRSKNNPN